MMHPEEVKNLLGVEDVWGKGSSSEGPIGQFTKGVPNGESISAERD
jgi:hypothetical protein